jgi:hypothetical protein
LAMARSPCSRSGATPAAAAFSVREFCPAMKPPSGCRPPRAGLQRVKLALFSLPRSPRTVALVAASVLMLTLLPVNAALADEPTYPTRNGPKTESALRTELQNVGYQGPWDLASELNAYDRAAAPLPVASSTPAPAPAIDPMLAANCFEWATGAIESVAPYAPKGADAGAALQSLNAGCRSAALQHGSVGVSCYESGANLFLREAGTG